MKQTLLGWLAWLLYRPLSLTWRVACHEPESMRAALREHEPFVLAHWHGDELASPSKDGRIMATVLRLMGARIVVGSSSRGGAAGLKGLIRIVREGFNCSFAVDGPRGPIYKLKPGVLEASRLLDCPIYYASVSCDRAFHLHRAWNRAYLPKPFARIEVQWYGPIEAIERCRDPRDPVVVAQLEQLMVQAKREARVPGQEALL
jgi:lysophospholipid acyltransferase (LPLAT)-like uncharacterized protein